MASKKKRGEASGATDLVQVMTVSLFIILLAFFILLNSIAVIDEERRLAAWGSLLQNFGILAGGPILVESELKNIISNRFATAFTPIDLTDLITRAEKKNQDIQLTTEAGQRVARIPAALLFDREDMNIRSEPVVVRKHRDKCTVSIPADLLFEPYGTALQMSGYPVMDKLAASILKNDVPVEIVSYLDNIPVREVCGMTNLELTALRSTAVFRYFIDKSHISPRRLMAYGRGEYGPEFSNSTKETREMNRRVDIEFRYTKSTRNPRGFFSFKNFFFKTIP